MTSQTSPENLFAEMTATPLGQALVRYLVQREVQVVLQAPADLQAGGYYSPSQKMIFIDPALPLPAMLHALAHEIRHVGQHESDQRRGMAYMFKISADPAHFRTVMRVKEIDADVFAVYFLYDHAQKAQSGHFAAMAGWDVNNESRLTRHLLYQRFDDVIDVMQGARGKTALRAAMAGTGAVIVDCRDYIPLYDDGYLRQWRQLMAPSLAAYAVAEGLDSHAALMQAMDQKADDTVGAERCRAYARLFNDLGVPEYLNAAQAKEFARYIDRHGGRAMAPVKKAIAATDRHCRKLMAARK